MNGNSCTQRIFLSSAPRLPFFILRSGGDITLTHCAGAANPSGSMASVNIHLHCYNVFWFDFRGVSASSLSSLAGFHDKAGSLLCFMPMRF